MKKLKEQWQSIPPRARQFIVPTAVAATAILVIVFSGSGDKKKPIRHVARQEVVENLLTERDTRSVTIDSLAGSVDNLKNQMQKLDREIGYLKGIRTNNSPDAIDEKFQTLQQQNEELRDNLQNLRETFAQSVKKQEQAKLMQAPRAVTAGVGVGEQSLAAPGAPPKAGQQLGQPRQHWLQRALGAKGVQIAGPVTSTAVPERSRRTETAMAGQDAPASSGKATKTIKVFTAATTGADEEPAKKKEAEVWPYLPATTIVSGVVITGLDAPTGQTAQESPFPALIRIKKDAILPNRFRASIQDCHALVSGYGSLAEERVYLRGETVACVANDGRVFEAPLNAYLIGEDGKAGIRGRLVHRAGSAVGKAMMAAFWESVGQAFDVKPVPILQTSGNQDYSSSYSPEAARSAAVAGAGAALEKLSEYYLNLAEQQHPILEIDAGRGVDLVTTRGFRLEFKEVTDPKLGARPVSASAIEQQAAGPSNPVADAMMDFAGAAAGRGRR